MLGRGATLATEELTLRAGPMPRWKKSEGSDTGVKPVADHADRMIHYKTADPAIALDKEK